MKSPADRAHRAIKYWEMIEFLDEEEFLALCSAGIPSFEKERVIERLSTKKLRIIKYGEESLWNSMAYGIDYWNAEKGRKETLKTKLASWKGVARNTGLDGRFVHLFISNLYFCQDFLKRLADLQVEIIWKFVDGEWRPVNIGDGKEEFLRQIKESY